VLLCATTIMAASSTAAEDVESYSFPAFNVNTTDNLLVATNMTVATPASLLFQPERPFPEVNVSEGFLLLMMLGGAIGFYLGIDTPQRSFNIDAGRQRDRLEIEAAELLSAIGTFLAAFSAFASVGIILMRHEPHLLWTSLIIAGWVLGICMQIVAGAIARLRAR
jgi:hypothetical protein